MALIGDAAHRVHPLAGQGLNLGLADVAYLANTILSAKNSGADIGHLDSLSEYERLSKQNAYAMIAGIEFVKKSYAPDVAGNEAMGHVLAVARNAGIDMIEFSDLLKFNFINFASGNVMHPGKYLWTE